MATLEVDTGIVPEAPAGPTVEADNGFLGSIDLVELGIYLLVFIVGILIVLVFFSRNIIALIGGKNFFILIAVSVILNAVGSFITSCFGQGGKKKENFNPLVGGMFLLVFGALVLSLVFYYYLIKILGFKNYLIVLCVISLISSVYGWSKNCI